MIGAAVLLLIASFLPFFTYPGASVNAWDPALFPLLPAVHLAALITAGLFVAARFQPEGRKVAGLTFGQWGLALAVFVGWSALWSSFSKLVPGAIDDSQVHLGSGAWLTVLFGLALAVVAVLSTTLAALKAPLLPAPRPGQPQASQAPYWQQPYPGATQPGGYGYPGAPAPGPSYGGQPQPAPYGAPAAQPQQQPQPAASDFTAFWFAVPVARPLFPEDGSPSPIAELAPGTWYLAVDQRGPALVAQTQDGRRGVLQDTSGIQRG